MVIIGERLVYVTLIPEVAFVYVRGILQEKKKSLYFYFVLWWSGLCILFPIVGGFCYSQPAGRV